MGAPKGSSAGSEERRRRGQEMLRVGARLLSQRRPGEALAVLLEAAQLLPDDVDVAINLGAAYILQHRYRQALPILERATELAPENPMVWVNLAAAYLGRLETSGPQHQRRAIAAYERALALDPKVPSVHYNLGLIYKDQGAWERARACFQQALEVDPNDQDARRWLEWLARVETGPGTPTTSTPSAPDSAPSAEDG